MGKSKLNPKLIYLLIMVFIILVYYLLVYSPLSVKTKLISEQNYDYESLIQTAQLNSANINVLNEDISAIKNDMQAFDRKLDFGGKMPPVLDEINNQVAQKSIAVISLKIGSAESISKTNSRITKTVIDIIFTGSNENISAFIKSFEEREDRAYIVEQMNLNPVYRAGSDIIERYDCSIKLAVFYYINPQQK